MRGTPVSRHDDPRILEQRYLLRYLHAMEKDNSKLAARIYAQQRNTAILLQVLGKDHPHIRQLSFSTALAQAAERVEQKLPPQYAKYAKVFDKPKGGELPPRQPFDHGIELKETFIPKVAKSYPMNPKETDVTFSSLITLKPPELSSCFTLTHLRLLFASSSCFTLTHLRLLFASSSCFTLTHLR